MLTLPVTLTIAAGAAIVNIWLMARCGQARGASGVWVGDGGNDMLTRRMRAHANFAENAPIVLILLAALELTAGTSNWLWGIGLIFVIGRLAHALGMDGGTFAKGRMVGSVTTALVQLILAGWALWSVYSALL